MPGSSPITPCMPPIFCICCELALEVVHVELTLLEALHHPLGGLGLERLLRLLDQRDDVAHAEDAAGDAVGVELLERVHPLAEADELDRLAGDRAHRERRAAARRRRPSGSGRRPRRRPAPSNCSATLTASCPVSPSTTSSVSCGLVASRTAATSAISSSSTCSRPAVSSMHDVVAAERRLLPRALGDRDRVLAGDDRQRVDADLASRGSRAAPSPPAGGCRARPSAPACPRAP